jgi:hypothetical protein
VISALEIGAGFVLTAPLLTVATVLAAFELGRLATGDDEQRQIEVAGLLRIRKAVRPAGVLGGPR